MPWCSVRASDPSINQPAPSPVIIKVGYADWFGGCWMAVVTVWFSARVIEFGRNGFFAIIR